MIDVREAVQIAKEQATQMLGKTTFSLEEIEREMYNTLDVWSITLSYPSEDKDLTPLQRFPWNNGNPLKYKKFLIDSDSGRFVAMKIRELASV